MNPVITALQAATVLGQSSEATKNTTAEAIPDRPGKVDVSVKSIWETRDNMVDGFVDRLPFIVIGSVIFVVFYAIGEPR